MSPTGSRFQGSDSSLWHSFKGCGNFQRHILAMRSILPGASLLKVRPTLMLAWAFWSTLCEETTGHSTTTAEPAPPCLSHHHELESLWDHEPKINHASLKFAFLGCFVIVTWKIAHLNKRDGTWIWNSSHWHGRPNIEGPGSIQKIASPGQSQCHGNLAVGVSRVYWQRCSWDQDQRDLGHGKRNSIHWNFKVTM